MLVRYHTPYIYVKISSNIFFLSLKPTHVLPKVVLPRGSYYDSRQFGLKDMSLYYLDGGTEIKATLTCSTLLNLCNLATFSDSCCY